MVPRVAPLGSQASALATRQFDNTNTKARPIGVIGKPAVISPDLVVSDASGQESAEGGGSYSFSYSVQNRGATFNLPESIQGDFHLIVKTDTPIFKDPWGGERSTIRDGLPGLSRLIDPAGTVLEFAGEGNNVTSIPLTVILATPPDLQVAEVTRTPASVIAGQNFRVDYRVANAGGDTPSDQANWNDLIYLSKDRFLDVGQDRYVGKSASLVVHAASADRDGPDDDGSSIDRDKARAPAVKIDWSGTQPSALEAARVREDDWVVELAGAKAKEKSLAELTGLKVRVPR